ncbi:MAG: hypothetical protein LBN42_03900 [Oscillospiraceae bacterium]|jgi:hypothetical protein|nr:hypothetical protein [Oscillospiraceae bacterium]
MNPNTPPQYPQGAPPQQGGFPPPPLPHQQYGQAAQQGISNFLTKISPLFIFVFGAVIVLLDFFLQWDTLKNAKFVEVLGRLIDELIPLGYFTIGAVAVAELKALVAKR